MVVSRSWGGLLNGAEFQIRRESSGDLFHNMKVLNTDEHIQIAQKVDVNVFLPQ